MKSRFTLLVLISCTVAQAQLFNRQADSELHNILEQLVNNYSSGFQQLKTDVISMTPQTAVYSTNLKLTAALENTIVQHSGDPAVYSWSAVMMVTENFRAAGRKYASLCGALKQMEFASADGVLYLKGSYNAPDETKKFATTVFAFQPDEMIHGLKVAVSMHYEFPEWKVQLQLYQKEREDDEAPAPKPAPIIKPL